MVAWLHERGASLVQQLAQDGKYEWEHVQRA